MSDEARELQIHSCPAADFAAALDLVFQNLEPAARARLIAEAIEQSALRLQDRLWGAYRGKQLVAAGLVEIQAGRTAVFSVPRAIPGQPPDVAAQVLSAMIDSLATHRVRLVQTLLETDTGPDAALLTAAG